MVICDEVRCCSTLAATRGIDSDPYELYRKEREYFVERWPNVIRDDPYFHPALSLYVRC